MQNILVQNRDGDLVPIDINKIREKVALAIEGINGVTLEEIEEKLRIQFYSGISTKEIQQTVIRTLAEMIDVDRPQMTFAAARAFLEDLYHEVGKIYRGKKGNPYSHSLKKYLEYGAKTGRINKSFFKKYTNKELAELNDYIVPERDFQFTYLGIKTLYDRYLIKDEEGNPIELPQHLFMAVAMFLAQNEEDRVFWAKKFYDVISKFEVMVATPTLSNARTNRNQLSSCYQGSTDDSIEGIFDSYKMQSLLSKFGGGIGWDWSLVRASGGYIDGHKGAAGGIIPFLKIENDIAIAVDQLGTRKGAIAVYIEPWHLDVLDFLDLKKNSGEERRRAHDLFPGLWIPDLFMKRVQEDGEWTLFDPFETGNLHFLYGEEFERAYEKYEKDPRVRKEKVSAKDLWKKILLSYFETGSPFLAFKDEANRRNQNGRDGRILATNLCTEIFQNTKPATYGVRVEFEDGTFRIFRQEDEVLVLEGDLNDDPLFYVKEAKKLTNVDVIYVEDEKVYKAVSYVEKVVIDPGEILVCNLASINLSKVNTPEKIEEVVPVAVRMLDNVIDLNYYPVKEAMRTNKKSRAIGLGVMGEAQMIAERKIMFGSKEHMELIDEIMERISYEAIDTSANLAQEKGACPLFFGSNWQKGILPIDTANENAKELVQREYVKDWDALRKKVQNGMRNGYLMAVAPTSSISILVGTTQSVEPVYKRKWFEENLSGLIPVTAPNISPETWEYYVPFSELDQRDIVRVAAVRQKWIDQGQSLNIKLSLAKGVKGSYLNEIYTLAWKLGLKSTYYLRSESPEANNIEDRSMECHGCQ